MYMKLTSHLESSQGNVNGNDIVDIAISHPSWKSSYQLDATYFFPYLTNSITKVLYYYKIQKVNPLQMKYHQYWPLKNKQKLKLLDFALYIYLTKNSIDKIKFNL